MRQGKCNGTTCNSQLLAQRVRIGCWYTSRKVHACGHQEHTPNPLPTLAVFLGSLETMSARRVARTLASTLMRSGAFSETVNPASCSYGPSTSGRMPLLYTSNGQVQSRLADARWLFQNRLSTTEARPVRREARTAAELALYWVGCLFRIPCSYPAMFSPVFRDLAIVMLGSVHCRFPSRSGCSCCVHGGPLLGIGTPL